MKNSGGIKIIMTAALALIILAGTGAAVSLSNSGVGAWKYQRDISIKENSGTVLTNYQVMIELKGADFPSEAEVVMVQLKKGEAELERCSPSEMAKETGMPLSKVLSVLEELKGRKYE